MARGSKTADGKSSHSGKKLFTLAEANAMLPLVRAIVKDIAALAHELQDRQDRLRRIQGSKGGRMADAYQEELREAQEDFERDREKLIELEKELKKLGVELKDFFQGLVDFPSKMDGHIVYLCWKMDEPRVEHWHELDAGFAGRKRLAQEAVQH